MSDVFPQNTAVTMATIDKASIIMEYIPCIEARFVQLEANVAKQMDDSLSRILYAVMALERSFGERMRGLDTKIGPHSVPNNANLPMPKDCAV